MRKLSKNLILLTCTILVFGLGGCATDGSIPGKPVTATEDINELFDVSEKWTI